MSRPVATSPSDSRTTSEEPSTAACPGRSERGRRLGGGGGRLAAVDASTAGSEGAGRGGTGALGRGGSTGPASVACKVPLLVRFHVPDCELCAAARPAVATALAEGAGLGTTGLELAGRGGCGRGSFLGAWPCATSGRLRPGPCSFLSPAVSIDVGGARGGLFDEVASSALFAASTSCLSSRSPAVMPAGQQLEAPLASGQCSRIRPLACQRSSPRNRR